MLLLLCERWLELIFKLIAFFFLKESCFLLVAGDSKILQKVVVPLVVTHLHETAGLLCSQFVLRDMMAGSSFPVCEGEDAEVWRSVF